MSRALLAIGICAALVASAGADPSAMTITATDSTSKASEARDNVTLIKQELAAKLAKSSCAGCHIDASITKLVVATTDTESTITAEINITISDDRGVMISVLSGGSRAAVSSASLRPARLASLRAEALTAAVDGMSPKIARSLRPAHPTTSWLAALLRGWFSAPLPTS